MTLLDVASAPSFGAGGGEPYARALSTPGTVLYLHDDAAGSAAPRRLDVGRWVAEADRTDLALLRGLRGPVLDVGCGPGRMVRAALDLGFGALGIDISPAAIDVARAAGLPALERSVFDDLPRTGRWGSVLLADGNIGIGGDPVALLARCAALLGDDGEVVVESHPDAARDDRFVARVRDADGVTSGEFPWAEIGVAPLEALAPAAGLELRQSWSTDGRTFCRLATAR